MSRVWLKTAPASRAHPPHTSRHRRITKLSRRFCAGAERDSYLGGCACRPMSGGGAARPANQRPRCPREQCVHGAGCSREARPLRHWLGMMRQRAGARRSLCRSVGGGHGGRTDGGGAQMEVRRWKLESEAWKRGCRR